MTDTAQDLHLRNHTACDACGLSKTRLNVVPGRGDITSPLVFVGEAPGREEDEQARPWVGAAGKLLRSIIDSMPLMQSKHYFYTNTRHCRPPANSVEQGKLAGWDICPSIWLTAELQRINPKVIVACGRTACDFFRPDDKDMPMRWHSAKDTWDEQRKCMIVGAYHPSYILRQGVSEGSRDGNVALVSMVASLQRAMYYLVSYGIVGVAEEPADIIEALEEGSL